jgi:hypothetical protein
MTKPFGDQYLPGSFEYEHNILVAVQRERDELRETVKALRAALGELLNDYEFSWSELTDGQYGKPNTPAYVRANGLLKAERRKEGP